MNFNGQDHLLTLVQGHSDSTFSSLFSLETAMPIETKFHVEPTWGRGMKVCSNGPGHMIKVATMSICLNQKADDLESWYAALDTRIQKQDNSPQRQLAPH